MVHDGLGLRRCELSSYPPIESCALLRLYRLFPSFLPLPTLRISALGRRHRSTYILSYQLSFWVSMIRASPKAVDHNSAKLCSSIKTDEILRTNTPFERPFASHSLLIPWQTSPYALYKGVLCYPPSLKGGRIRASPGFILTMNCQDQLVVESSRHCPM